MEMGGAKDAGLLDLRHEEESQERLWIGGESSDGEERVSPAQGGR